VRVVLDTAILVRAHDGSKGLARELLLALLESDDVLLTSDQILYELAKVLRYPRMMALHGLSEGRIFDYVGFLREVSEIVRPNPWLIPPIRDVNDIVVIQTAILGEANIICTRDQDFFEPPAHPFLQSAGIEVPSALPLTPRQPRHMQLPQSGPPVERIKTNLPSRPVPSRMQIAPQVTIQIPPFPHRHPS
jgi:putative PIN family toxin of toxin-antitoxin system